MQLDKIFSTQFLDATTGLPLDSLTGVTITILEISETDGTTLSIPVNAQACINGGNGFYRYFYSGMGDKLYEYFINPNNTNTVIASGWVDKRLNRLDSNVSDIMGGRGSGVLNLNGVTSSINNLKKSINEKIDNIPKIDLNEIKSHIDIAKTDIIDTIEGIEIPEAKLEEKEAKKALKIVTSIDKKLSSYIDSEMSDKEELGAIAREFTRLEMEDAMKEKEKEMEHKKRKEEEEKMEAEQDEKLLEEIKAEFAKADEKEKEDKRKELEKELEEIEKEKQEIEKELKSI